MKKFYCLLFLSVLLLGCKKENDQDLMDILTSKTWKYSLVDKNTATNGTDINVPFNVLSDCEKDNVFQFKNDGTLIIQSGSNKCSPTEAETKILTYSYNKQTQEISIDGIKCSVLELTKSQFKYKAPVSYQTGYVYVMFILE